MCIAIYKPAGVNAPTQKVLKTCFTNNDDGAGFMFAYNGKVHIEKGFMSYNAFKKGLKRVKKLFGIKDDFASLPMVFHFRITTQGGIKQELCHPFALSNSYDTMKELSGDYDMGVAHNGIIDFASNYKIDDHNDTMEFIKEIAYPTINNKLNWYKKKKTIEMFEYLLKGNRVVILGGDGHAELIGDWIEDGGLFYSNTSYKAPRYVFKKLSDYELYDWNSSFALDSFNPAEKDTTKTKKKSSVVYSKLNDQQKKDLRWIGRMYCEKCGAELGIAWDDDTDSYYAFCPDCCGFYEMDEEDVWDAIESGALDYSYYNYNFTKQGA